MTCSCVRMTKVGVCAGLSAGFLVLLGSIGLLLLMVREIVRLGMALVCISRVPHYPFKLSRLAGEQS